MVEEKKEIPLEKILTVSASEYCASIGKRVDEYVLVGTHGYSDHRFNLNLNPPAGTEAIVGTFFEYSGNIKWVMVYGTALIPKKQENSERTKAINQY